MARLPVPHQDVGIWGDQIVEFLRVAHNEDGTLKETNLTPPLVFGSGDTLTYANETIGQFLRLSNGTVASPDTSNNPLIKIERTIELDSTTYDGDGVEVAAAFSSLARGTPSNDGQVVGIFGYGESSSTTVVSSGGDDACGIYGVGRIVDSGTGVGLNFLTGRRDTDTGKANALELSVGNFTTTDGTYNPSGFSDTTGLWVHANSRKSGVGISFGNPFAAPFDVGIGFTSQGTGGPIVSSSVRDDSSSAVSLDIRGAHTTALSIASGAGKVLYGRSTDGGIASDVILQGTDDNRTAVQIMAKSGTQAVNVLTVTSQTSVEWFSIGSSGNMRLIDKNMVFGTATGTQIGTSTSQKWATHGATPTVQRAGAAQAAVATTGATNTTPYGFTTAAQADALVTLVNELRAAMVEKGFIKGSA